MSIVHTAQRARNSEVSAASLPLPAELPATVLARLSREGVNSCEAWLALKGRRFLIFGLRRKMALAVDEAIAKAAT
jgi:hypothetical protein